MIIEKVNMELLQKMLESSRELNKMKQEIDWIMSTVLGLIDNKDDWRGYKFQQVIKEFNTPGLKWEIIMFKRTGDVWVYDATQPKSNFTIYTSGTGISQTSRRYIRMIYTALPEVVTNLIQVFPQLSERISFFIKV